MREQSRTEGDLEALPDRRKIPFLPGHIQDKHMYLKQTNEGLKRLTPLTSSRNDSEGSDLGQNPLAAQHRQLCRYQPEQRRGRNELV
jgi:hypothetical protein